ncbi:MAG: flagellar basal body rod protein [Myxococcales bacterium]|nr:flagellar basal body rod protein [Myxococcales bacterium]
MNDIASIALSGIAAGFVRIGSAAHNVANLTTEDFHPLRTRQQTVAGGGTRAFAERSPVAAEVDLAAEIVEQMRGEHQALAAMRVLDADARTKGALLDLAA